MSLTIVLHLSNTTGGFTAPHQCTLFISHITVALVCVSESSFLCCGCNIMLATSCLTLERSESLHVTDLCRRLYMLLYLLHKTLKPAVDTLLCLSSSLWGVSGLFPEGVSVPRAPAVHPRYTHRPGFGQQGGAHCPIRPGGLHWGGRGGCLLRGCKHPQGGSVWSVWGRAGVQRQIVRLLFLDSK